MRQMFGVLGGLAALGVGASSAQAGTFLAMDLPELVANSEAVVLGEITDVVASWTPDGKVIVSDAVVSVDERLIGSSEDTLSVRTFGGVVDDYEVVAHGFPVFEAGEQVVLFLTRHPVDQTLRVTGYQLGHYRVIERGEHLAVVPTLDQGTYLLDADGHPVERPIPYELSTFARMLRESTSTLDETP